MTERESSTEYDGINIEIDQHKMGCVTTLLYSDTVAKLRTTLVEKMPNLPANCTFLDGEGYPVSKAKEQSTEIGELLSSNDTVHLTSTYPIGDMTNDEARWSQQGITVAGGNGDGSALNQFCYPVGIYVHDDESIFIADSWNERIMQWKRGATEGQVVAGGNGYGLRLNQLYEPSDVILDKETNSLIICDAKNSRVMKWSLQEGTTTGEILIDKIWCWGLAMDDQRNLYVTDVANQAVRRYKMGESTGTVVAGGNGQGDQSNQLSVPYCVFVDQDYAVYVSDQQNHRVMKWTKGARTGIIVAGGRGSGLNLIQMGDPCGMFVDKKGTVFVAENGYGRVTRWC
ncbi:unnamed protein product [Adineta steineri]|uniref:NHL repeat containing protein-like protein n=1 Tax=Adineta steineri TaxID=433720 RepID=A0A819ZUM0_9BILA|nr:unnamed protein product [Adineta steineri]CAF4173658.1 unnamed protein product [Adineta steineri]